MKNERYRVPIDGEWDLVDLNEFPRIYRHLYSVIYSFEGEFSPTHDERLDEIFTRYSWKGGFSTTSWFNDLYLIIPVKDRPQILSIQYASPGWIDLGLYISAAISIRSMLVKFSSAVRHVNETYNQIENGIHKRKLNEIKLKRAELRLERENQEFAIESCEKMAEFMGFKHLKQMHKRTGNPFVSLKMLQAIYRQLRELQQFEIDGKTRIRAGENNPSRTPHRPE